MANEPTRRDVLRTGAAASTFAVAGCTGVLDDGDELDGADYTVWALDQGTDMGYIYAPADGEEHSFELIDEIDFAAFDATHDEAITPHMVDFSSDYEYAAIACTTGSQTLLFETESRELVDAFDTGPSSHFAGFTPDDEYVQVDVIGEGKIARIDADVESGEFSYDGDDLVIADDPTFEARADEFDGSNPICHQFTQDGHSYHTLGPSIDAAGLVTVDLETFEIAEVFSPAEIRANCGTIAHPTESKFYLTAGAPSNHDSGGVGEWYVFDTDAHRPLDPDGNLLDDGFENDDVARDTGGYDAHGFWFTPDAEELWVLNRETDDGIVIDPETDERIDEIEDYGPAPDILAGSPDGEYMFASLRGPNPQSGDPHAATGDQPGFSVLDIDSREVVEIVQPDPDDEHSDFHAIGVVPQS